MIEELKAYRERNDITQIEMAKRLGVSERWYNLIEQGKKKPGNSLRQLIEIHIGERCCGAYSSDAGCCNKE